MSPLPPLRIASAFCRTPGARTRSEGPWSGQAFRDEQLHPALRRAMEAGDRLIIDLDGTAGYSTGFLEEAFGGLVRHAGFTGATLHRVLILRSAEEPELIADIWGYIDDADQAR